MAGIDSSIYFQQKPIDIMGSVQKGLSMRDMLDKRSKEKGMDEAYKAGMVTGPDGKVSFDPTKTAGALAEKGYGREAYEFNSDIQAKQATQQKAQYEKLTQTTDFLSRASMSMKKTGGQGYQQLLIQAKQMGADVSMMPPEYGPDAQQKLDYYTGQALSAKEQMDQMYKQNDEVRKDQAAKLDQDKFGLEKQKFGLEKTKALSKGSGLGLTEGEKAVDKDYAKDFNDFTGGGETKAVDGIKKLRAMREEMAKDNGFIQAGGGPISGSMADMFRTQTSIARRDNIVSVANSALKATFGGQLSDGERKALANEFYNDKLSNEENLKVIDRKIQELENGLTTQRIKAKHFSKNRSLQGFGSGNLEKMSDDQLFEMYTQAGGK